MCLRFSVEYPIYPPTIYFHVGSFNLAGRRSVDPILRFGEEKLQSRTAILDVTRVVSRGSVTLIMLLLYYDCAYAIARCNV